MVTTVTRGATLGSIVAPASKSVTQRALAAALLHNGVTTLRNVGASADEEACINIIRTLGATVDERGRKLIISSDGQLNGAREINAGESGLATRLFAPICALAANPIKINGRGSLLHRPMCQIAATLEALGVAVQLTNGHLPATIQGPISAGASPLYAGDSSQLITGILFALSQSVKSATTIIINELTSKPYIDLTLNVLRQFGRLITHRNYKEFTIYPLSDTHQNLELWIEGDWSGAANLMVAAAISGSFTISNLDVTSKQADRAILDVLNKMGAEVVVTDHTVSIVKRPLRAFSFDATNSPDLFPILAILGALAEGESHITGLSRLLHKESNRKESISDMLRQFGVRHVINNDTLSIIGQHSLAATTIDAHNDHRIAMAAAVGALRSAGEVHINGSEAVNKSYPDFFADLAALNITVR